MNGRSVAVLGFAVVLGLVAMLLSRVLLGSRGSPEPDTLEVLVANRDLKEEELLKLDMIKTVRMPKSAVPAGAFASFKEVEDRWVRTAMLEGDPIIEKKLGPKGTPPGLVANIPLGMRAFALDVTEQSSVSGFILPGHHVDVVRFEPSEKGEPRGETILQNVLVLAAGQTFTRKEEHTVQSRTVTLALTPDDVNTVVAARSKGVLSLSLRGVNDKTIVPKPPRESEHELRLKAELERRAKLELEIGELKRQLAKKAVEPPARPTPAPERVVWIYRGPPSSRNFRADAVRLRQSAEAEQSHAAEIMASRPTTSAYRPKPTMAAEDSLDELMAP